MLPNHQLSTDQLRVYESQIQHFKVNELQQVLAQLRVNRVGKKSELAHRVVESLRSPNTQQLVLQKISEVSKRSPMFNNRHHPYAAPPNGQQYGAYPNYAPNGIGRVQGGAAYPANGYHQQQNNQMPLQYPHINSNPVITARLSKRVEMMPLPFFDPIVVLMDSTEMPPAPHQANDKAKISCKMPVYFRIPNTYLGELRASQSGSKGCPRLEVQLRFFNITGEITKIPQADDFPLGISVRLDDHPVTLPSIIPTNKPNVEPKRPSRPVDLTTYLGHNIKTDQDYKMMLEWQADRRTWAVSVTIVRRVDAVMLRDRKMKEPDVERDEAVRDIIRRRLNGDDDDVAMDSLKISLSCPLMRTRMVIPAKSRDCTHLQCFDLMNYLQMNEKRPTWKCCVCSGDASFSKIVVNQYFTNVLKEVGPDVNEVELLRDGSYRVLKEEVCDLSDDDDDALARKELKAFREQGEVPPKIVPKKAPFPDDDVITLSDDDEDAINLTNAIQRSMQPSSNSKASDNDDSIIILDDSPPRPSAVALARAVSPTVPPPPTPPLIPSTTPSAASIAVASMGAGYGVAQPRPAPPPTSFPSQHPLAQANNMNPVMTRGFFGPTTTPSGGPMSAPFAAGSQNQMMQQPPPSAPPGGMHWGGLPFGQPQHPQQQPPFSYANSWNQQPPQGPPPPSYFQSNMDPR